MISSGNVDTCLVSSYNTSTQLVGTNMSLISYRVNLEDLTADDLKGVDCVLFKFIGTSDVAWFEFKNTGVRGFGRWKFTTYMYDEDGIDDTAFPHKYLPDAEAVVDCVNQLFDVFCDNYAQVNLVLGRRLI